jgi:amicyanin
MTTRRARSAAEAAGAVAIALALVALAALLGSCVSERQDAAGPTGTVEGACTIPIGSPVVGSTQAIVAIRNFGFHPDTVHVKRGTTVTWVNCENATTDAHTTTSQAQLWDSPFLPPGSTYSHTFEAAGAFGYFCTPHPFMRGAVVVE